MRIIYLRVMQMRIFTFAFAILFAFKNSKGGSYHLFTFTFL